MSGSSAGTLFFSQKANDFNCPSFYGSKLSKFAAAAEESPKTWMAGSSPAMTSFVAALRYSRAITGTR
ncbi:MAG: hypothetical protein ABIL01_04150 [Pseudomonadota bacterium]